MQCAVRYHCLPCGCVYQVRFDGLAEGTPTALALGTATEATTRRLLAAMGRACPTCGLVRPERPVRWQFRGHAGVLLLALVVACGVGALVVSHSPWITPAAIAASVAAGIVASLHVWIALINPNRGRRARRERAQADVAAGAIEVLRRGSAQDSRDPGRASAGHWLAFLALALAPLPFLAPVYVDATRDLPDNPGLAPYVIGPGDVVRVPIPDSGLHGVGGRWRASATAQLLNAEEVGGPAALGASSRDEDWGNRILVHKDAGQKANEDLNVPIRDLYADVSVPDVAALGGKSLRVKVTMNVSYPVDRGHQFSLEHYWHEAFANQSSTVSKEVVLHLASGNDHRDYRAAWEYGAALGGLFYFAGGLGLLLLTSGRRPGGYPPELVPADEPLDPHS
ncbi:MAG TPA: hypothetical protein VFW33_23890 [Gemmataceae bacterium]|nr:hypothetical protein [Gemmataceae bacterium]